MPLFDLNSNIPSAEPHHIIRDFFIDILVSSSEHRQWMAVIYVMKIGGLYPATFIIVVTRVVVTTDATAL